MNITRFILICDDAGTKNCEFDCIYKNDPNASCFKSEEELAEVYLGIAEVRGEIKRLKEVREKREPYYYELKNLFNKILSVLEKK